MIARAAALAVLLVLLPAPPALAKAAPVVQEQADEAAENRDILVMLRMPASHFRPNARYGGTYDDAASQSARRRVARGIARDNGLELVEGWPMPLIGVDCFVMRVPEGRTLDAAIEQVSRHRMVAWSQPLQLYETLAAGDDPLFATQPAASAWRLADLHEIATGKGVRVAVIDSRIDVQHPDLAGQFVANRDFLANRPGSAELHGTGVAGIIAARAGNGIGIAGVAPEARLMALRACFERRGNAAGNISTCDSLTLAKALHFALERDVDVVNMSLSGPQDRLLTAVIEAGQARNVAFVAAFDPQRPAGGFPASLPGVFSVAEESLRSLPERVYRAPGRDVPTTQPGGRWNLVNGNSFAAAHVTGLLALLWEERGSAAARSRIARAADGAVDACATLVAVTADCRCPCAIERRAARRRD